MGLYLASIHQMAPPEHTSINRPAGTWWMMYKGENFLLSRGGTGCDHLVNPLQYLFLSHCCLITSLSRYSPHIVLIKIIKTWNTPNHIDYRDYMRVKFNHVLTPVQQTYYCSDMTKLQYRVLRLMLKMSKNVFSFLCGIWWHGHGASDCQGLLIWMFFFFFLQAG